MQQASADPGAVRRALDEYADDQLKAWLCSDDPPPVPFSRKAILDELDRRRDAKHEAAMAAARSITTALWLLERRLGAGSSCSAAALKTLRRVGF